MQLLHFCVLNDILRPSEQLHFDECRSVAYNKSPSVSESKLHNLKSRAHSNHNQMDTEAYPLHDRY